MEIIAHRGDSGTYPENTLLALDSAFAVPGIAAVEFDVHSTRDGQVVVFHDATLDRTTNATSCGYAPGTQISALTLAQLGRLDAGAWFGPAFAGARIPTLREVIDRAPPHVRLCVELKGRHPEHVQHVVAALDGVPRAAIEVWGFDQGRLAEFARRAPEIPGGLFFDRRKAERPWSGLPLSAVGPWPDVQRAEAERAHTNGLRYVATASSPERVRHVASVGADAVIADFPEIARMALGTNGPVTPLGLTRVEVDRDMGRVEIELVNGSSEALGPCEATLRHDQPERLTLSTWRSGETRRFAFPLGPRAGRWPMLRPLSIVDDAGVVLLVADY